MVINPGTIIGEIGTDVSFTCTVDPLILLETVSISWAKKINSELIALTSMRTLSFKSLQQSDAGDYVCTGQANGFTSQANGTIIIKSCELPDFQCSNGVCLDANRVCDDIKDCPDGSDEADCKRPPPEYEECDCDENGSLGCDVDFNCICKDHYDGVRCETCAVGFYQFPDCIGNLMTQ